MTDASQVNPIVAQLTKAITPVVSVGVGSAIWKVCNDLGKRGDSLTLADLPVVKAALLAHYKRFWANKMDQLEQALAH